MIQSDILIKPASPSKQIDLITLFLFLLLVLFYIFLYLPAFPVMYQLWMNVNGNNSHGILVPFISLFLIWTKRKQIVIENVSPSYSGLFILIVSLLLYILGFVGGIGVLVRLSIVSTLIGLVIFNLGMSIFRTLSFPLLFLFFMVPVPVSVVGLVSFPLQIFVTKISAFIISNVSIPVFREGNMLYFANTSLEVAEACSGIRSLIAFLMLGVLFAYLTNTSTKRKSILVFLAVPLAFLTNLLRVTATGTIAHFWGGRIAKGFLHEFSGLAVFVFGLAIYIILCKLIDRKNSQILLRAE